MIKKQFSYLSVKWIFYHIEITVVTLLHDKIEISQQDIIR